MIKYSILDKDNKVIPAKDYEEWREFTNEIQHRVVGDDTLFGSRVLTI